MRKILIVGAGKMATNLCYNLHRRGWEEVWIANRTYERAEVLAQHFGYKAIGLDQVLPEVDLVVIAVRDDVLRDVADRLRLQAHNAIVVHTAAMRPIAVLDRFARCGLFYVLGSFSSERYTDFAELPIVVEGNSEAVVGRLKALALEFSERVYELDLQQRKWMHLAAVWANNFTNHLLGISQRLLCDASIPEQIMHPIIRQTFERALVTDPRDVQTGPALRGDVETLRMHRRMMRSWQGGSYAALYDLLSLSIARTHGVSLQLTSTGGALSEEE